MFALMPSCLSGWKTSYIDVWRRASPPSEGLRVTVGRASLTEISIEAATVGGALGSLAGDATSAAIQHQSFTAARAGEDLLVGAVGGAVGAGAGELASSAAMRMAMASEFSRVAIVRIGTATSSVVGGSSSGFAGAATSALLHHESLFSANTAIAALVGAVSGAAGAFISGGAHLSQGSLLVFPVELTEVEAYELIVPGRVPAGHVVPAYEVFAMGTTREMASDLRHDTLDLLRTTPKTGDIHMTIIAHGEAGRMYATVRYQGEEIYRPLNATVLRRVASRIRDFAFFNLNEKFSGQIKLISCNAGWTNAQKIANAIRKPVWAAYKAISVSDVPT